MVIASGLITQTASAESGPGGGGAPAPVVTPTPAAPAVSNTRTVRLTRSQTKSVQRRVRVRPDGVLGAKTRVALRRYQERKRLTRTGRPNLETLRAMKLAFAKRIAKRLAARQRSAPKAPRVVGAYAFPIQGKWSFGGSATGFGDRDGAHQGVDLLSACGTPVVAASNGSVKERKRHGSAGNYVVLTDTPSGEDQVYMHLQTPSPLKIGARVDAGSAIGSIGRTGNATTCLLHFELWSAPGWYEGGSPRDPSAGLRSWKRAASS
ncbi:MAG: M23 family metallopeptidase [Solirubrobacteraceae bacterium]